MKIKSTKRKEVAPIFRAMQVGDVAFYSPSQKLTLESTRCRIQNQIPGIKFSIIKENETTIKVSRTA